MPNVRPASSILKAIFYSKAQGATTSTANTHTSSRFYLTISFSKYIFSLSGTLKTSILNEIWIKGYIDQGCITTMNAPTQQLAHFAYWWGWFPVKIQYFLKQAFFITIASIADFVCVEMRATLRAIFILRCISSQQNHLGKRLFPGFLFCFGICFSHSFVETYRHFLILFYDIDLGYLQ